MADIRVSLGCMNYFDRTQPILDGTVSIPGVELACTVLRPPDLFPSLGQFDIQELSTAGYVTLRAHGDDRYVGLPIFTWKSWLLGNIVVNANAGIKTPADLAGKRVGTPGLYLAGTMWIRGYLRDAFGLTGAEMKWHTVDAPAGSLRKHLMNLVTKTSFEVFAPECSLSDMLDKGEIDLWVAPALPECFLRGSQNVRRLFPNYAELEEREARSTRNLPLLHNLLLSRTLHERHPWIAQALIDAFACARQIGNTRLDNDGAYAVGLPWIRHDLEKLPTLFNGDWYACSLSANKDMLGTMARYAVEQGFTPSMIEPTEYFIAERTS
jgi:4,5-dihydroxyphthalate decarboxylase